MNSISTALGESGGIELSHDQMGAVDLVDRAGRAEGKSPAGMPWSGVAP